MIRKELIGPDHTVGLITFDRVERRNALDAEHWTLLHRAIVESLDDDARVLVLTGKGSVFCAGADLGSVDDAELHRGMDAVYEAIRSAAVPVIAAVNGAAVGAGAQLAVLCDLRVAAPKAKFAIPAAKISLPLEPEVMRRLEMAAGGGVARAMLLGGEWISAERAHHVGLVDRIGELDDALEWACEIAEMAPLALAYFKRMFRTIGEPALTTSYKEDLAVLLGSDDFAESVLARAEKRPPNYRGR